MELFEELSFGDEHLFSLLSIKCKVIFIISLLLPYFLHKILWPSLTELWFLDSNNVGVFCTILYVLYLFLF